MSEKEEDRKSLADSLIKLLYFGKKDKSRYELDQKFIEENVEAVSKAFDKASKRPDDLDRILRQCVDKVKGDVFFRRLHPESKSGRKTHQEALDEKFIRAHLTEIEDALQEEPDISVAFKKAKEVSRSER